MKRYFSLLIIPLLFLSGCGVVATQEEGIQEEVVVESDAPAYVGTWLRQGTYVDGENIHSVPSTLEMQEETYHSETEVCWVSGEVIADGDEITMSITDGDCPVVPGYEVITHTQSFSDDLSEMTIVVVMQGVEIREEYKRSEIE